MDGTPVQISRNDDVMETMDNLNQLPAGGVRAATSHIPIRRDDSLETLHVCCAEREDCKSLLSRLPSRSRCRVSPEMAAKQITSRLWIEMGRNSNTYSLFMM